MGRGAHTRGSRTSSTAAVPTDLHVLQQNAIIVALSLTPRPGHRSNRDHSHQKACYRWFLEHRHLRRGCECDPIEVRNANDFGRRGQENMNILPPPPLAGAHLRKRKKKTSRKKQGIHTQTRKSSEAERCGCGRTRFAPGRRKTSLWWRRSIPLTEREGERFSGEREGGGKPSTQAGEEVQP